MDKVLNLENFDAKKKHPPYIDSPRSIQACKVQGIDPEDLLFKPKSYFRKQLGAGTHKAIVKLHFEHCERRRQNKLQIALQEYRNLCRGEFSRKTATSKSRSIEQDDKNHFLIEHEKKKIAMLEKKTQQEIAQMLEHEKQMEAIRKRNEEKERLMREKEMWRLKQLEISAKEREEQRLAEERERKMREEEEQNELRRKQQIQYEMEQRKIEEEKRKEKQRMKEARLREMERMKKQEELKEQTEKILNEQRLQVEMRKKEMEQREKERLRLLSERQQQKKAESEALRREKEEKLAFARQNLERLLTKQKKLYEDKQRRNEMKRLMFENMREEARQEMASKALEKQKNIEKVKEISQNIEEQRKHEYLESMRKAEERKKFLDK
jgi:hypothetical protein